MANKRTKPTPRYTKINPRIGCAQPTDEEEKVMREELKEYRRTHKKAWYL